VVTGNEQNEVHGQGLSLRVRRNRPRRPRVRAQPRIERLSQGVAEEIGAQHSEDDCRAAERGRATRLSTTWSAERFFLARVPSSAAPPAEPGAGDYIASGLNLIGAPERSSSSRRRQ
jgi:hypothetical protein